MLEHHGQGCHVRASRPGLPGTPEVSLHLHFVFSPSSHQEDHWVSEEACVMWQSHSVAGWGGGSLWEPPAPGPAPQPRNLGATPPLAAWLVFCLTFLLPCEGHVWPASCGKITPEKHLGPRLPSLGSSQLVGLWTLPRSVCSRLPSLHHYLLWGWSPTHPA